MQRQAHTSWLVALAAGLALILAGVALAGRSTPPPSTTDLSALDVETASQPAPQPPLFAGLAQSTLPEPVTVITVTTVEDNANVSMSETCSSEAGDPDDSRCTLRRAIVEARNTPAVERPVLIQFDLPASESNDPADPAYWVMQITPDTPQSPLGSTTGAQFEGGQIILDGTTQPIGRDLDVGPRVFVPNEGNRFTRFVINGEDNYVVGIGWLGLRLIINNSNNVFERNWFGLVPEGDEIYLFEGDPRTDNNATLEFSEAGGNNLVQNNVFAGARTNALTVRSNGNTVQNNFVGTRGDGTVPDIDPNRQCRPNAQFFNWFGGGGIVVSGASNLVQNNTIVGLLFASGDVLTTPDNAITVEDGQNTIISNTIGIDRAGTEFGVCGRGIILTDRENLIENNTIVGTPLEGAIGIRGSDAILGANTIRNNTVKDAPQSVFIFPRVSNEYEYFNPAKITSIVGTTVTGESGDPGQPPQGPPIDSTCLGCIVEIFLDDTDALSESLVSLGTVASSPEDGTFTFELDAPLTASQFLRTTSTSVEDEQIFFFEAGATTKTSLDAYGPNGVLVPGPFPEPEPNPVPPDFDGLLPVLRDPPPLVLPAVYSETITVTTSADFNVSRSETCTSEANEATESECTLRRAINEANNADGPALIQFAIPTTDSGYNAELGVWVIQMSAQVGSDELEVNGDQVVIDGLTQPDGRDRSEGPSVFVRGANNFTNLVIRGNGTIIKDLGWQQVELVTSGGDGIFIENNWLGLTEDGQSVFIIGSPTADNNSTIDLTSSANVVRGNVLAGARDAAMTVRGQDNFVVGNYVGTRGDGTVPEPPEGVLYCEQDENTWFGGGGIQVANINNQIGGPGDQANIIGSTFIASAGGAVQPASIEIRSARNMVYGNIIGRDATGADRAVCGEGVRADSLLNIIERNVIYGAATGILTAGIPNQYIENQIIESVLATGFTQALQTLRNYNPALVTEIDGTTVSGTNGAIFIDPQTGTIYDPFCPFCTVQIFIDNEDGTGEALEFVGSATTDANGDWTTTISRALAADEGLRTLTITGDYASISQILAEVGFSTKLSEDLYQPGTLVTPTPTATVTPTSDPNATPTPTAALTSTVVVTTTATMTATVDPDATATMTVTVDPNATATMTATVDPNVTATATATVDPDATATATVDPNATATATATVDPNATATPAPTVDPNATATPAPTTVSEESDIEPGTGGQLDVTDDGLDATISVPGDAISDTIRLSYTGLQPTGELLGDGLRMRIRFVLVALIPGTNELQERFNTLITIAIDLNSVAGINLSQEAATPQVFARNDADAWVLAETLCQIDGCTQSLTGDTLTLTTDYTGEFALGQENTLTNQIFLPAIRRAAN